ncbi:MAG: hypothetical protein A3D24_01595 [Candidatus Blackburnbacteria bacterium RIFCSPHIGHO2_02_FULL_39_13]|uniref:DOD-type homing endonuclease domain-containing protein n=1 Tax=Candidatus Blackburnbacteria bacterium RIFCSPLOWO2_01_FULL_40_20 TaxID=1797519 RepID=A0A1G1VBT6_9BACT|nr:MAG: Intein-containing protein [Microgenomates group bacterium GW2011_GWA2_39_19]OGY07473.1 MAG: hypothetical protein A2694_01855 [Candidatus Blackburnbacteria bacterium RIFCSPHIGHO2_01_FULL_40_17]OGY10045.1 MAG: hypothetical protein A3D24_01595 [Candidatus Blackburnbacteria bacterium RIFCSPHIGHO2_02_FULL_39_13]OGY12859.1 MAG: hypothetical protein A3A77_03150 [Candidatus Blackburnbacteria bacterium RIFCSPLOWO2_01_FULL_40_20]
MNWTAELCYVIGLITTDGNLSKDLRHIEFTSKDLDQVETFASLLKLKNKISVKSSCYRIQFGNVKLYQLLLEIGLMPNKTKILGPLKIPDLYFADFLRGYLDGDGYTYSYWDKRWKNSYMLYTGFVSASENHIKWLQEQIKRLYKISGVLRFEGKSTFSLKFAKVESLVILSKMYYESGLPCLKRKYSKIERSLGIIERCKPGW